MSDEALDLLPPVKVPVAKAPVKPTPPKPRPGPRKNVFAPYERDFVGFVDRFVKVGETGQPFELYPFQRELFDAAFEFDADGRLAWDTFVYSTVKKSGKTALNGLVTLWWALTQEIPNELFVLANDQEQAQSRAFAAMAKIIKRNRDLRDLAKVEAKKVVFENETTVVALASDYASAAGSNHGLVSFDELWAYVTEGSRRLVDEMTPVPTRRNSIRFVSTYAGFEGESDLLRELYLQGVGPEEHEDGKGVRIHPTLPLYLNAEARLLVYWDHEGRLPWQTERYYAAQRKTLRPSAYIRLHENRWTTGESAFITPEMWDAATDPTHRPVLPTVPKPTIFVGVDASTKHDTTAVVAVRWNAGKVELVDHRIWTPSPEEPIDLEATVEGYLRTLRQGYAVRAVKADPFQLHSIIGRLALEGLAIEEFPQTPANLTRMGEALLGLLNGKNLRVYPSDELRAQAMNTSAEESTRGWKISKQTGFRKIDSIIALAMACVAAAEHGPVQSDAVVASGPLGSSGPAMYEEQLRRRAAEHRDDPRYERVSSGMDTRGMSPQRYASWRSAWVTTKRRA
jgi:phage terminase large subunit-like protein